jgi:hypothetical protein
MLLRSKRVRPGGDWRYKLHDREFESFGNFNFGATAAALEMPYLISQSGAGVVNIVSNIITMAEAILRNFSAGDSRPLPEWWSRGIPLIKHPFGDDYKDVQNIAAGYASMTQKSAETVNDPQYSCSNINVVAGHVFVRVSSSPGGD